MNDVDFAIGSDSRLAKATVKSVRGDGLALISCNQTAGSRTCEVLAGPDGSTPALAAGDRVLVWLAGPDEGRDVIIGRIGRSRAVPKPALEPIPTHGSAPEELLIEAGQSLTLKCGEGSITLRADGKILIRGEDLVSHAKRANRIRGGSVAIN